VVGLSQLSLGRFVARASRAIRLRGTVNVLVTGSRELRSLNRRFRRKDRPTDVLSFPAMPGPNHGLAGDIAISSDIAAQNSRRLGHSVADEVRILALHGLLHLAGHDHEFDNGEMARKEARLRAKFGLPSGLIERTSGKRSASQTSQRKRKRRSSVVPRSR